MGNPAQNDMILQVSEKTCHLPRWVYEAGGVLRMDYDLNQEVTLVLVDSSSVFHMFFQRQKVGRCCAWHAGFRGVWFTQT